MKENLTLEICPELHGSLGGEGRTFGASLTSGHGAVIHLGWGLRRGEMKMPKVGRRTFRIKGGALKYEYARNSGTTRGNHSS